MHATNYADHVQLLTVFNNTMQLVKTYLRDLIHSITIVPRHLHFPPIIGHQLSGIGVEKRFLIEYSIELIGNVLHRIALVHLCIHLFASGDNARIMFSSLFLCSWTRSTTVNETETCIATFFTEHLGTLPLYFCYLLLLLVLFNLAYNNCLTCSPVYRLPLSFDGIEGRHLPTSFCFYQKEYRSGKSSYD